jgi:CBS domain containing-hemolysin-like protein
VAVAILIAGSAFFVAAEFALLAVDRTKVNRAADAGDRSAGRIRRLLQRLSFHLAGAQLGITVVSLILGFVAEPAIAQLLEPAFNMSRGASIVVALAIATVLQMIFGELVPKTIAISRSMSTASRLARPMAVWGVAAGPVVSALNSLANWLARLLGAEPTEELMSVRSLQELEYAFRSSGEEGTLDPHDVRLLTRSVRFGEKTAADALVPRTSMVAIEGQQSTADLVDLAAETGFSRFPVVGEDVDDVLGVVHVKAVHAVPAAERATTEVAELTADLVAVPEHRGLVDILVDMRQARSQLAVVVDEHGGTAGILTLEDIIEEIVGEIDDEHDPASLQMEIAAGSFVLSGTLHPDEVNEASGFEIPEGDYETLGGFTLDQLQRIPVVGELFLWNGWTIEVVEMDELRVATLRLTPPESEQRP